MSEISDFAQGLGFAEMMSDDTRNSELKTSYTTRELLHGRDWGHEPDFQFDDEGEYGEDMPF